MASLLPTSCRTALYARAHINNIAAAIDRGGYAGVNIDYRHLPATAEDRANFAGFVKDLATELGNRRKLLTVSMESPIRVSDDPRPEFGWNTGGYDWQAIGEAADTVRVLVGAEAGDEFPALQRVLAFATTQVDRQKLEPVISVTSSAVSSKGPSYLSYDEALALASAIEVIPAGKPIAAGESATVTHTYLASGDGATPFYWDAKGKQYRFSFEDGNGSGAVWLQNAASVAFKLNTIADFAAKGAVLRDPTTDRVDPSIWSVVRTYVNTGRPPAVESGLQDATLTWQSSGGQIVPVSSSTDITWKAPMQAGSYTVTSALPANVNNSGAKSVAIQVVVPTPTVVKAPTATAGSAGATPTATKVAVASAPATVIGTVYVSGEGDSVYLRSEAKLDAKLQAYADGTKLGLIEKLPDWYRVQAPDGKVGYMPAQWISDSPPPTATPRPAGAPPVAYAPATGAYGFGYGMQVGLGRDGTRALGLVSGAGFNWIKLQVRWGDGGLEPSRGNYQLAGLDGSVNAASAAGLRVLLSVVTAPSWSGPSVQGPPSNFQDIGNFMGALASRYKGKVNAYEVWNEQNLRVEWEGRPISAADYVQMLRVAYNSIKAADPSAVVLSGALTPTGATGPDSVDDRSYLRQMYDAGLKGVSDGIGVHPSGFGNAPDASFPSGDRPDHGWDDHPSFYFRNTMEDYHNIMVAYGDGGKQLWPTEFGWCIADPAPLPNRQYCSYNSEAARASYVTTAYQMARNWGFVGPMFIWNLDWRTFQPGSEQAQFGIINTNWSSTPAYDALKSMGK